VTRSHFVTYFFEFIVCTTGNNTFHYDVSRSRPGHFNRIYQLSSNNKSLDLNVTRPMISTVHTL